MEEGRPWQALSKLTTSTALGLVVFLYGWMLINPELLAGVPNNELEARGIALFEGLYTALSTTGSAG